MTSLIEKRRHTEWKFDKQEYSLFYCVEYSKKGKAKKNFPLSLSEAAESGPLRGVAMLRHLLRKT